MNDYLPPEFRALFEPRPPIEYIPPMKKLHHDSYTGVSAFLSSFEDAEASSKAAADAAAAEASKPHVATMAERREAKKAARAEENRRKIERQKRQWDPRSCTELKDGVTRDPYSTLFIARLPYDITEREIKRELGLYGHIRKIVLVKNVLTKKPRGYGFVEYMTDNDMQEAYKRAFGLRIKGRRLVIDFERGRTMDNWYPKRLGGGLGETRLSPEEREERRLRREAKEEQKRREYEEQERQRQENIRSGKAFISSIPFKNI